MEFFRYGGCEGAVGSPASAPSIHKQGRILHRSDLNNENMKKMKLKIQKIEIKDFIFNITMVKADIF